MHMMESQPPFSLSNPYSAPEAKKYKYGADDIFLRSCSQRMSNSPSAVVPPCSADLPSCSADCLTLSSVSAVATGGSVNSDFSASSMGSYLSSVAALSCISASLPSTFVSNSLALPQFSNQQSVVHNSVLSTSSSSAIELDISDRRGVGTNESNSCSSLVAKSRYLASTNTHLNHNTLEADILKSGEVEKNIASTLLPSCSSDALLSFYATKGNLGNHVNQSDTYESANKCNATIRANSDFAVNLKVKSETIRDAANVHPGGCYEAGSLFSCTNFVGNSNAISSPLSFSTAQGNMISVAATSFLSRRQLASSPNFSSARLMNETTGNAGVNDHNVNCSTLFASVSSSEEIADNSNGLVVGTTKSENRLQTFTSPESAFYDYQSKMGDQMCEVCQEPAAGFHHGAYVCEACKKFFMRHWNSLINSENSRFSTSCPTGGKCQLKRVGRGKCQQCRLNKCLSVGMYMQSGRQGDFDITEIPCRVCGGKSSGFHFGALTCEGCKGFFRRTEAQRDQLTCMTGTNNCEIGGPSNRMACKSCRFQKCLEVGMSRNGSRIGRQPNAVKFHCALEITQLKNNMVGRIKKDSSVSSSTLDRFGKTPIELNGTDNRSSSFTHSSISDSIKTSLASANSCHHTSASEPFGVLENAGSFSNIFSRNSSFFHSPVFSPALKLEASLPQRSQQPYISKSNTNNSNNINPNDSCIMSNPPLNLSANIYPHSLFGRDNEPHSAKAPLSEPADIEKRDIAAMHFALSSQFVSHVVPSFLDKIPSSLYCVSSAVKPLVSAITSELTSIASFGTGSMQQPPSLFPLLPDKASLAAMSSSFSVNTDITSNVTTSNTHNSISDSSICVSSLSNLSLAADSQMSATFKSFYPLPFSDSLYNFMRPSQLFSTINADLENFKNLFVQARELILSSFTDVKAKYMLENVTISKDQGIEDIWARMMKHFEVHTYHIVFFAKKIPGFNDLCIDDKRKLICDSMYPVILLELSRDFIPPKSGVTADWQGNDGGYYNYFDFNTAEREIIFQHFPTFRKIEQNLITSGEAIYNLGLDSNELSLCCAVEVMNCADQINDKELGMKIKYYARTALSQYMEQKHLAARSFTWEQYQKRAKSILEDMSPFLQKFNEEHHRILAKLKIDKPNLIFPDLYMDLFHLNVSDGGGRKASCQQI